MVATSNGHGQPLELAEKPSVDPNAQAHAHAHAHEEPTVTLSELPARRVSRWALPAIAAAFRGGSLLTAPAPSLATLWAWHRQCATHYEALLVRWPRYWWGAAHIALVAVLYAVAWVTTSPPLFICAAGVITACWFWS